jgi:hypothetical protein
MDYPSRTALAASQFPAPGRQLPRSLSESDSRDTGIIPSLRTLPVSPIPAGTVTDLRATPVDVVVLPLVPPVLATCGSMGIRMVLALPLLVVAVPVVRMLLGKRFIGK